MRTPSRTYDPSRARTRAFLVFRAEHPEVETALVQLALAAHNSYGQGKVAFRLLWNLLRVDGARLDDHLAPFYVRLLEIEFPQLTGAFVRRAAPEADEWAASYATIVIPHQPQAAT